MMSCEKGQVNCVSLDLGHQAILRGRGAHVGVGWMEVGEEKYSIWKEPFP